MLTPIKNWLLDNAKYLAFLVSLIIIVLSLVKSDSIPLPNIKVSDKLLHTLAYTGLIWSWLLALRNRKEFKNKLILLVVLFLFGILMEYLQGVFTDYRTPDLKDVLANVTGLFVGLISFRPVANFVFGKLLYQ